MGGTAPPHIAVASLTPTSGAGGEGALRALPTGGSLYSTTWIASR